MIRPTALLLSLLFTAMSTPAWTLQSYKVDVCIYGGTASGMMAAIAASKAGKSVIVVEPSRWLGGMVGGGLRVAIDCKYPRDIGGLTKMMLDKDAEIGGESPHEGQWAFREYFQKLAEEHEIHVLYKERLGTVKKAGNRILSIVTDAAPPELDGCPTPEGMPGVSLIEANVFIDASYEGDLMAAAGVTYTTGRESRDQYKESLAGVRNLRIFDIDPYVVPGEPSSGLLPMIDPDPVGEEGSASRHTMAWNFRLQFEPEGVGTPLVAPAFPRPDRYELVRRALAVNRDYIGWPNGNYNRRTLVSTSIPGRQTDYINAAWPERAEIWREWIDHAKIMHQLTGARETLKRGEYPDSGDFPPQLYIRLARRMIGEYVMTQHDLAHETTIQDSIGLGFYFVDIYPCRLVAVDGKVAAEGETNELVSPGPYPISYRALTPKRAECENLLVSVCVSASHVALASMRMEPTYMIMGESAGIAAAQAVDQGLPVQDIDQTALEEALTTAGQKTRWDGQSYADFRRGWEKWKRQQDEHLAQ